jgi:hypothetical protein
MVKTNQDIAALNDRLLGAHRKLGSEFTQQIKLLVQKNDMGGVKKAEEDFKAASDELLEHLSIYTAEGTARLVGGEIEIDGRVRLFDYKGADKALGKGKALIAGQAMAIKDKEGRPRLAIRNGDTPIAVSGKLAEGVNGTILVHGVLRAVGKSGPITIDADSIK